MTFAEFQRQTNPLKHKSTPWSSKQLTYGQIVWYQYGPTIYKNVVFLRYTSLEKTHVILSFPGLDLKGLALSIKGLRRPEKSGGT